jgi:hypothetical protein
MDGNVVATKMRGVNSKVNRSGSLKLNATAEQATDKKTWTGERPERGERVELGYAGHMSVHEPPRTGGRPHERLRHVQARATGVAGDLRLFTPTTRLGPGAGLAVPANVIAASASEHPP